MNGVCSLNIACGNIWSFAHDGFSCERKNRTRKDVDVSYITRMGHLGRSQFYCLPLFTSLELHFLPDSTWHAQVRTFVNSATHWMSFLPCWIAFDADLQFLSRFGFIAALLMKMWIGVEDSTSGFWSLGTSFIILSASFSATLLCRLQPLKLI